MQCKDFHYIPITLPQINMQLWAINGYLAQLISTILNFFSNMGNSYCTNVENIKQAGCSKTPLLRTSKPHLLELKHTSQKYWIKTVMVSKELSSSYFVLIERLASCVSENVSTLYAYHNSVFILFYWYFGWVNIFIKCGILCACVCFGGLGENHEKL